MPGRSTVRGYIEKKKDWLERTRDYKKKVKQIRYLKRKAKERNPDEFSHHMVRSQVRSDGVHEDLADSSDEETEVQKLLSDIRDLDYVKHKYSLEQKKIEKLKSVLHFPSSTKNRPINKRIVFVDNESEVAKKSEELSKSITEMEQKAESDNKSEEVKERYAELKMRMKRAAELRIVMQKLELKKNLHLSKGNPLRPKCVQKGGPTKPAVYRWIYERKK